MELKPGLPYRALLKDELKNRKSANSRYSLRAFARDLGVSPARLSHVLNGHYNLSTKSAQAVAARLGLANEDRSLFTALVESESGRSPRVRDEAKARLKKWNPRVKPLPEDSFRLIADWHHLAILELFKIDSFRGGAAQVSDRLGIPKTEAIFALERLERLGMIRKEKRGRWRPTGDFLANPDGIPSAAVRSFHEQILQKAQASVHGTDPLLRELGVVLQAIDPEQLPKLKLKIQEFLDEFDASTAASNPQPKQVYCISVQLFPVDQAP